MTILWFGFGLCIALFILFCILIAIDTNVVDLSKELPKPDTPSKSNEPKVEEKSVNISEPVLSFVEVVRKQPQRFHTKVVNGMLLSFAFDSTPIYRKYYYLRDNKTGYGWKKYALSVESQGWCSPAQEEVLVHMWQKINHYECVKAGNIKPDIRLLG